MGKKPIFNVTENEVGQRLDNFLLKHRKQVGKSNWYKLIRKGLVRVNGKRVKPLYKLVDGDQVRIPPSIYFTATPRTVVDKSLQDELMQRLIFENTDYLVINKPAGLAVHTGTGHQVGVIEIITSIKGYQNTQLAHRLDKNTSGCLLLAKNRPALLEFQQAMINNQVNKQYKAVICGVMKRPVIVNQPLDTENRIKGIRTVVVSTSGKEALTHFIPLKDNNKFTLVECKIESGRTHQIRVHAQHLGMSILGDRQYGGELSTMRNIFLHADLLKFNGWSFEASLPAEFMTVCA